MVQDNRKLTSRPPKNGRISNYILISLKPSNNRKRPSLLPFKLRHWKPQLMMIERNSTT
jgi:hypothetical protein